MGTDYAQRLVNAALPYWEAEAEIARRFFAGDPSQDQQALWLRAMIWKELNPVDGYFNGLHRELSQLAQQFDEIDRTFSRHEFGDLLTQLSEEFQHYVAFADVLEYVLERPVQVEDRIQLSEEKNLQALRKDYVESGSALQRAAVLFTEGGGARIFREGAKLSGSELQIRIAQAMKRIYDDEKDHFLEAARQVNDQIKSEQDAQVVIDAIIAISRQRVQMRSEMFSHPIAPAELDGFIDRINDDIAAGKAIETV